MPNRRSRRVGLWRRTHAVRRVVILALFVAVALVLRMASQGLPDRWVARVSHALSTEEYFVDLEDVVFTLRRGLSVGRARVSSSDPAEAPMLTLELANVRFRWHWGVPSLRWVRAVNVQRVVLASLPGKDGVGRGRAAIPVFGPLLVRCAQADLLGTAFRDLEVLLESSGGRLDVERYRCDLSPPRHVAEELRGEITFGIEDGSMRGTAQGDMNPVRLIPLLRMAGVSSVPRILERFEFPAEPASVRIRFDVAPDVEVRRIEAVVDAGACLYRGVPFMSARASITAEGRGEWETLRVDRLEVERPEGSVRGTLRFDLLRHGLDLSARSSIEPRHLSTALRILGNVEWDDWLFGSPAEVTATGYYGFEESERPTAIEGHVRLPSLRHGKYRAGRVDADFVISPERCLLPNVSAALYGGEVEASGEILWPDEEPVRFAVTAEGRQVQLGALQEALGFRTIDETGRIEFSTELRGNLATNALRTLQGNGRVRVRDARLYRMPLFAGFTDFIARYIPGVDFMLNQDDLNADFTVEDNGLQFSKLEVEGSVFSIAGSGSYWFTDHLDIGVRVNLLKHRTWVGKVLKVALFPVSKLLELELTGSVRSPRWAPTTLALRGRRGATDEQRGVESATITRETTP